MRQAARLTMAWKASGSGGRSMVSRASTSASSSAISVSPARRVSESRRKIRASRSAHGTLRRSIRGSIDRPESSGEASAPAWFDRSKPMPLSSSRTSRRGTSRASS